MEVKLYLTERERGVLFSALNAAQAQGVHFLMQYEGMKPECEQLKDWYNETLEEYTILQQIKKQFERDRIVIGNEELESDKKRCSICGGSVIYHEHLVYRTDGGSSGTYNCQDCGAVKSWFNPGNNKEEVIDMGNEHNRSVKNDGHS